MSDETASRGRLRWAILSLSGFVLLVAIALVAFWPTRRDNDVVKYLEHTSRQDGRMSTDAYVALSRMGVEAVPQLIEALGHGEPAIRSNAAHWLGEIGDKSAAPFLVPLLEDNDPDVAQSAACALSELKDRRVLGALVQLVNRSSMPVSWMAATIVDETVVEVDFGMDPLEYNAPYSTYSIVSADDRSVGIDDTLQQLVKLEAHLASVVPKINKWWQSRGKKAHGNPGGIP